MSDYWRVDSGDFVYFDSANSYTDNSGNKPGLTIKYY